jgi:hypothetical protein
LNSSTETNACKEIGTRLFYHDLLFVFRNVATDIEDKATIVAGSTGQQYIDNIFVNPANAYELMTVNKSR